MSRSCGATALKNFAASAVFVDSPERASAALAEVVWLATRDRTRAVTSHRRSARAVLAKLRIPTAGLKGTWLVLAADEAVRAAAAEHRVDRPTQPRCQAQSPTTNGLPHAAFSSVADDAVPQGTRAPREAARAGDTAPRGKEGVNGESVKVIELGNSHRGGAANSFSFEVLR